jgi:hypothetical protein
MIFNLITNSIDTKEMKRSNGNDGGGTFLNKGDNFWTPCMD